MTEEKDFVTICVVCGKGVTRDELKYVNGRVFHPECFDKHGSSFLVVNQDLIHKSARTKIELVQLKNLKMRTGGSGRSSSKSKKRTTKRKPKRKASRKTKKKSKRRTSKTKRRTTKRRKVSKKKSSTRRKTRTAPKRRKDQRPFL